MSQNILGVMRIKNEERWIRRSIESQLPFCRQVLVLDDHSTDSTRDIVAAFGDRCILLESPFEGVNEGRDKRYLLEHILTLTPDWCLWIDGDEELDKHTAPILLEEASNPLAAWFTLPVLYFWNSETTYRSDGCYGNFHRRSFFRVSNQDPSAIYFPAGTGEAELHGGGNCPAGLVGEGYISRARIKHFGYLDPAERQRKYEWYNKIDPNNESEDCYRHIIETPGARHAPGPTVLETWSE